MATRQQQQRIFRSSALFCTLLWTGLFLVACGAGSEETGDGNEPPTIEVTAADYAFAAPDTIPSGWVTFRMENQGEETHYFLLDQLPEGRTFEEFQNAFITPVDSLHRLDVAGTIDSTTLWTAIEQIVPDWARPRSFRNAGGVGYLAPGRVAETTVKLEPGTYTMVCALRAPSDLLHVYLGMIRPITATEASNEAPPPVPDVTLKTSGRGLTTQGTFQAGRQTVALQVESSPEIPDSLYSANLAHLGEARTADEVLPWDRHNPATVDFIGGIQDQPAGQTAYITTALAPGRYAWSVDYGEEPLIKAFTVE